MTFLTPEPTTDESEPDAAEAQTLADDPETSGDAAEAPAEAADETPAVADDPAGEATEEPSGEADPAGEAAEEPSGPDDPAGGADPAEDASISPYDRPGKWYVVHTQSGYENKVKKNLEARIASMNMEDRIFAVEIPMEDVVEFKNGKKQVVPKKMFPGYLLTRAKLDDDSWYVIRNTPGITGFVGQGAKPSPLRRRDVENFLGTKEDSETKDVSKVKVRSQWELSETVRVKEGPFADFSGEIIEINDDQLKVKVLVNIFGRETPVELEFGQIAKL